MSENSSRRCSRIQTCKLFPKFALRSSLKVWAASYCEGSFETCERYKLATANRPVPENMLPNGRELNVAQFG